MTPFEHTAGTHIPFESTRPMSQAKHDAPGPEQPMQPMSHGAHVVSCAPAQNVSKYVPIGQVVHGLHTRSPSAPHGCDSNMLSLHGPEHAAHTVSVVGMHCDVRNSLELHVVHAAHCCPVPVKPGMQRHSAVPPISMQSASALHPPLFIEQTDGIVETQIAEAHVLSTSQAWPQAPQFSWSKATSAHTLPQACSPDGQETNVGCAHATRTHHTTYCKRDKTRTLSNLRAVARVTVDAHTQMRISMGHCTRVALAVVAFGSIASAEPAVIGKAKIVSGKVQVVRGSAKSTVKVGDVLNEHDVFETGADGSLGVTFTDNTSFSIGPNSHVAIDTYFFDPKNLKGNMLAQLKKGTMMVRSGELTRQQPGSVQIKTPRTVLGVRGTTFVVSVDP
jgi:hypothetical protein